MTEQEKQEAKAKELVKNITHAINNGYYLYANELSKELVNVCFDLWELYGIEKAKSLNTAQG